ncbi:MAG TPA: hypothetical protein V6D17_19705 [Candidatus Obscuribacterales bacterium]
MARSYRHTPIIGMTLAESEKKDKRIANRRERSRIRQILHTLLTAPDSALDALVLPHKRELSNVWSFDKDGKQFLRRICPDFAKYMRK